MNNTTYPYVYNANAKKRKPYGGYPIGVLIHPFVKKVAEVPSFKIARLLYDWPMVVGDFIGAHCQPDRVIYSKSKDNTLVLKINGAMATELTHFIPQIIERVNQYFGHKLVDKVQLKHGILVMNPQTALVPISCDPLPQDVMSSLECIEDAGLRQALENLAISMQRKKSL